MLLTKKRAFSMILVLAMALGIFAAMPRTARAATGMASIDVSTLGGTDTDNTPAAATESPWNYIAVDRRLLLTEPSGNYTLTGANVPLIIEVRGDGANIILNGVSITAPNSYNALDVYQNCTVTLVGVNTLTGSSHAAVGMRTNNISLIINGSGSLAATTPGEYGITVSASSNISVAGTASVTANTTAIASGIMCYGDNTINVGSGASLSTTGYHGISVNGNDFTLNSSGTVTATGNTGYGIDSNAASTTLTLDGSGIVTMIGAMGAIRRTNSTLMGENVTLTMTNNSGLFEDHTFARLSAANTRNWKLTPATILAAGALTDPSIGVTVPANSTGTVEFEPAPAPFGGSFGSGYSGGTGKAPAPAPKVAFPVNAEVVVKRITVYKYEKLRTTLFRLDKGEKFTVLGLANNGRALLIEHDGQQGYVAFKDIGFTLGTPIRATALKKAAAYGKLDNGNLKRIGYYDKDQTLMIYGISGKYLINRQGNATYYLDAGQWRLWVPAN